MKKLLFAVIALLGMSLSAGAQRVMKVEKTDGTVVEDPVTDVKRVFFEEEESDEAVKAGLCPDNHHPHIIDLGLGVKWSCCNVGASKPYEYGGYYAWGETKEKDIYNWETYQYGYYNHSHHYDYSHLVNIGSNISGTSYDAATANWGAPWRMPTKGEVEKLLTCSSVWMQVNGVNGRKFTSSNGNSIFLPVAGIRWDGELVDAGDGGVYWSSTLAQSDPSSVYSLIVNSDYARWSSGFYRFGGQSVRPVR